MRASQLSRRVLIQSRVDVKDSAGGFAPTWTDVGRDWADVTPMIGGAGTSEMVVGDVIVAATMYKVTMRFRSDLTVMHRIVLLDSQPENLPLNILSLIDPDGRRRELSMVCQSGETSG